MKKLLLSFFILSVLLVGCNTNENEIKENEPSSDMGSNAEKIVEKEVEVGYTFDVNGVAIAMHQEAAPILKELGTELAFFEALSCAFQGMEKVYTYNGFEVQTYELEGVDYIAGVGLLDDSIPTPEGIYLYSTLDEMIAAYGEAYIKNIGLYTYTSGEMTLSFLIEDDQITGIEYMAVREKE